MVSGERRDRGGSFRNLDELLHRLGGEPVKTRPRPDKPGKDRDDDAGRACKAFLLNERLSERSREHR